jgi:hypothetical protein
VLGSFYSGKCYICTPRGVQRPRPPTAARPSAVTGRPGSPEDLNPQILFCNLELGGAWGKVELAWFFIAFLLSLAAPI